MKKRLHVTSIFTGSCLRIYSEKKMRMKTKKEEYGGKLENGINAVIQ